MAVAALAPGRLSSETMASHPDDFVPVRSDGFSSCSQQLEKLAGSPQNGFSLLLLIPLQVTPTAIASMYTISLFGRRF